MSTELVDQIDSKEFEQLDSVSQQIVKLIQDKPKGITTQDISTEIPDLPPDQTVVAINKLLSKGLIALFKQGQTLIYKLKDPTKSKGADLEEKIVYNIVQEAGNKGIWLRDIRQKSNIAQTQLTKILKSLESKRLIKAIKSVAAAKRKVYMLYNLEPDRSVTGGAWYQDQEFDCEFSDILNKQCYRYLEQKRNNVKNFLGGPIAEKNATFASSEDIWKFISDLGISNIKLSVEDMETILDTLVYDGKAERNISSDGSKLYRAINPLMGSPGLVKTPCGLCPVRKNCCDVGDVTPIKCQYINEWLRI